MEIYQTDNGICIKPENEKEDIILRENEESLRKTFNRLINDAQKKRNASSRPKQ
ncbi:hypothetical protein RCF75_07030 [Staphylococcus equorum]|uniref:hypothetical protein n=1 Tax=Staphylococcus equorum TaxID=246432 RepID=UPI003B0057A8